MNQLLIFGLLAAAQIPGNHAPSAQMRAAIMKAADAKLLDGASARFKWPPELQRTGVYCGWVNAKNKLGGYVGWTPFVSVGGHQDGPKGDGSYDVGELDLGSSDPTDISNTIIGKFCPSAGYDISTVPTD